MQHIKHCLILVFAFLAFSTAFGAADNTRTKNNKAEIYDNLYEIYLRTKLHRADSTCLQIADTMRRQAIRQGDLRAIAMSWANPLSYYMGKDMEKELYQTIDSLMKASEKAELWSFYYYALSQKSTYMLRHLKVGEALQLGEHTMNKAYAENNQNGKYTSHIIMLNCYMILELYEKAEEEALKAIQLEIGLPDNDFGNSLIKLAEVEYKMHKYQKCIDMMDKYMHLVQSNTTRVRLAEYETACYFLMGKTKEYKRSLEKRNALYAQYGKPSSQFEEYLEDGIRLWESGDLKGAEDAFYKINTPDRFMYLTYFYQKTRQVDSLASIVSQVDRHWMEIHKKLYETDIKKYGLELENSKLEQTNHELELESNRLKLRNIHWAASGLLILFVCLVILYINKRQSNKQLKRANQTLELQKQQLQENLETVRKANQASDAKTSFLFNMSHDIRTPMNAILGFSDLVEKHKDNPEMVGQYVDKIKTSGDYLLSLINNVLDMARIESGKIELNETFYDMEDPANKAGALFESIAREKKITLTQSIDIQHRYVLLDKTKVHQIVVNILSNALKYTPEGGSVHYSFREIPCQRPGYATFVSTFTDTGIGMSEEFVKKIYDMFSRERNTTESKVNGSGLGMVIVKKLVDMMGGTIEIQTEQGRGSTFTVTMSHPIVEHPELYKQVEHHEEQITTSSSLKGKHILLAEDNELNAEIAISILEDMGIEVEHAEDGLQCIEKLTSAQPGHFDCILMDVQMPNLNGYDATRRIRSLSDASLANIPIIAMTANVFDEDKRNAAEAGMNGHLAKPIDVADMKKKLTQILNK